mmetsp:Transcript_145/g.353  ORF Transcript_145/g.353 Transcript_145/m.353 type:complete len:118 (-) Transcript_145:241-594(-)
MHGLALKRTQDGRTALHYAAEIRNREGVDRRVVTGLVEAGADVKAVDRDNNTALHLAAKRGHTGLVRTLLSLGASTTATNSASQTPGAVYDAQTSRFPDSMKDKDMVQLLSGNIFGQ